MQSLRCRRDTDQISRQSLGQWPQRNSSQVAAQLHTTAKLKSESMTDQLITFDTLADLVDYGSRCS